MFPEKFTDIDIATFNQHYRSKLVNELKFILTGDIKFKSGVKKEEDYFVKSIEPKNLNGMDFDNVVFKSKKEFETVCVVMCDNGVDKPEKLTVLRFFTTIKFLESKNKPKQK